MYTDSRKAGGQGEGHIVCVFEDTGEKVFETRKRPIQFPAAPLLKPPAALPDPKGRQWTPKVQARAQPALPLAPQTQPALAGPLEHLAQRPAPPDRPMLPVPRVH